MINAIKVTVFFLAVPGLPLTILALILFAS